MEEIDILPAEQIAFIAYNIGVFESVQKFGGLITSGRITNNMDVSHVAELLAESSTFFDAEMIAQLVNTLLQNSRSAVGRVSASQVNYVLKLLKSIGVSLP